MADIDAETPEIEVTFWREKDPQIVINFCAHGVDFALRLAPHQWCYIDSPNSLSKFHEHFANISALERPIWSTTTHKVAARGNASDLWNTRNRKSTSNQSLSPYTQAWDISRLR
jgi:hypothetical protein